MKLSNALSCLVLTVGLFGLSACDGKNINMDSLMNGAMGMAQPLMISDSEVVQMAAQSAQEEDAKNTLAPVGSPYDVRLQKIAQYINIPGYKLHFSVYMVKELNAFALPNGEVRVYSGLMDAMSDQELLFVVGHEVGHVVHRHSLDQYRLAAAASGMRGIAATSTGTIGQIASGQLGGITEKFVNAQFSQTQEQEADDYGASILKSSGISPKVGAAALRKLASGSSDTGFMNRMFSSHPDPEKRAQRIELMP